MRNRDGCGQARSCNGTRPTGPRQRIRIAIIVKPFVRRLRSRVNVRLYFWRYHVESHHCHGAAGFIGSNLVKALNARGYKDVIAVDHLKRGEKFQNLLSLDLSDYIDKKDSTPVSRRESLMMRKPFSIKARARTRWSTMEAT